MEVDFSGLEVFVPQIRAHTELTHRYDAYYDFYDDGKLNDTMEMIADPIGSIRIHRRSRSSG